MHFAEPRLSYPLCQPLRHPHQSRQVLAARNDHEIKHDGYRLIVERDGLRARLFTRPRLDTDRFPLIVEAALRNRRSSFVLDGEAVLLGVDAPSTP